MTGDISRKTFERAKDFSLVRMQQGRLFSDADWNEQGDILRSTDRETTVDVVGHAGFPEDDAGFALIPDAGTGALVIAPGRAYVAGVGHRLRLPAMLSLTRQSGTGGNAVWRIDEGGALGNDDILSTDPSGQSAFVKVRNFAISADGVRTFRTTPALGDGARGAFRVATVTRQPYGDGSDLPDAPGRYLAVLESIDLAVTALDEPSLREVAFDGPDTAFRDRTTWRVSLMARDHLQALGFTEEDLTCPALAHGFDPELFDRKPGQMRARAELSDLSAGPCTLPPAAGYRSLDNLLYRVEIHGDGDESEAFYKWSRENATHRTRYDDTDAGVLLLESTGRDEVTVLKAGQWIEIRDQDAIHGGRPGFFAQIDEVVGQRVSIAALHDPVTLDPLESNGLPDTDKLPPAAFVTLWESGLPVKLADSVGIWTNVENGVQVAFDKGAYRNGDHWTIPARAVSGDVEWPRNNVTTEPLYRPAEGPRRDFAALAWLDHDGNGGWTLEEDCRPLFPPITEAKQLIYSGGDGQEVLDDPLNRNALVPLDGPLQVSVVRGHSPLAGERVRFEVIEGNGVLEKGQATQIVETDGGGLASMHWRLDGINRSQRCLAQRLNAAGVPTHAPITFNATLSRASHVSFDPENTPALGQANTVQEAIEALLGLQAMGCNTYIIQPGQDWVGLLESLQPGEDASICFARGKYRAARTVRLSRLGHIRISGPGKGVVEIIADRTESALAFEECASVSIGNLSISTPAGNDGISKKDKRHRQGTLDFGLCRSVSVSGCAIACGGGVSTERSCISVRGWSETIGRFRPTDTVTITHNTLTVGNLQEGIVVTDAVDADISGNRLKAKPGRNSLAIEKFLRNKRWVSKTVKSLVAQPVVGNNIKGRNVKQIAAGPWRMTFNSPVSQRELDALVRDHPPRAADTRNPNTFNRYADRLIGMAVDDPDSMASFKFYLERLGNTLGDGQRFDDLGVRRALLVASNPVIERFDARSGSERRVVLEANSHVLAFDSPFNQRDWSELLKRSRQIPTINSADALLDLSMKLAERALLEPQLRRGLQSVNDWLQSLARDGISLGAQGIVCGGRRLDSVRIADNRVRVFEVGIRVAVSHKRDGKIRAGSVSIDGNRLELCARGPKAYAGYGLMVGNTDTLRIRSNALSLSDRPNYSRYFAQGIRIWGRLGNQILVAENRIALATMGIRIYQVLPVLDEDLPLWVFRENLIEGPNGLRDWHVTPNWALTTVNNRAREIQ